MAVVSTHAPARGATDGVVLHCVWAIKFQPTRPHGARLQNLARLVDQELFQPTRPHGARQNRVLPMRLGLVFQPTRPHGARLEKLKSVESAIAVSTHAPARGATRCSRRTTSIFGFQPTRPHGARPCCTAKRLDQLGFQPTRPHGARPATSLPESLAGSGFNPRARTGRDAVFITC